MKDQSDNALGSVSSKSLDPQRNYGTQDQNNKNNFYYNFCGVRANRKIYRLKQHLVVGYQNMVVVKSLRAC